MTERRQSKAYRQLSDEHFAEYKRLCLPREAGGAGETLEAIATWAAGVGCKLSVSMVSRDAEYFRACAERVERIGLAGDAARQIAREVGQQGGVAGLQQAAQTLFTNAALDFLMSTDGKIDLDNLKGMAQFGATLARLTSSEVSRSQAERLATKFDAEMEALAKSRDGKKGITPEAIAAVRKAVFGG